MGPRSSVPVARWQATLILMLFAAAVTAAAAAGWWYARESAPHHGPIVLISVDGLRQADLAAYGAASSRVPPIDALATDAVVFERAYAHSPLSLPAHASMLAGQLPFEHGVRDEAGFAMRDDARPIAELLRNRGFETGAAVSSFLLRAASGVAQGFSFFDADFPVDTDGQTPFVVRDGNRTAEAAERWLRARRNHRFFLFVQVDESAAEVAITRLVDQLRELDLYDRATIVLTADSGEAGFGVSLDEAALRVPLLVKQPDAEGAGRRVSVPVQHIDLLPTLLDLVRAPVPDDLRGRSLRPILEGDEINMPDRPIYAETLAGRFRFGGPGKFSVATSTYRYIRGSGDEGEKLVELAPAQTSAAVADPMEVTELRTELDRLLEGQPTPDAADIRAADEEQFAALGYLPGVPLSGSDPEPLTPEEEAWIVETHRSAAILASQKNYSGAITRLAEIGRAHPRLAVVQYQLGTLLGRIGRIEEAKRAFGAAALVEPDNPYVPLALGGVLLRAGRPAEARDQAMLAVALADHHDGRARAAAHELAARVSLAVEDFEEALVHAEEVESDDAALPMADLVRGRESYAAGRYEEALVALERAESVLSTERRVLEGLHLFLGETLVQLERYNDAEEHFRAELRAFPRSTSAYSSLAALFEATGRPAEAAAVIEQLLDAIPTPEGYTTAASLWTILGEPARASAVRAEVRSRFRDGLPPRIVRDGRR